VFGFSDYIGLQFHPEAVFKFIANLKIYTEKKREKIIAMKIRKYVGRLIR
jgi:hypothetical protein